MGCEIMRYKKQRKELMVYEQVGDQEELIPGLPNDVALQCLLRIPAQAHAQLQRVSRKWRQLVNSPQYYEERKREGTTMQFVCTVQALQQNQKMTSAAVALPGGGTAAASCPSAAVTRSSTLGAAAQPIFGISVFNTRQRTWERLPHIPQYPHGLPLFCRLVAANRDLVVLGGWDPATWETLRSVYVYNFTSQSWHKGADMPSTRSSFACGALNNHVFVAGGHDNKKSGLATAEVYSVEKNEWRTLPRMSQERDESTGVALNGKFYVISGYSTHSQGQFVKSSDVYDPEKNSWTRIEGMRGAMAASDNTLSCTNSSAPDSVFAVLSGALYTVDHTTLLSVNDCLVVLTGCSSKDSKDQGAFKTFMYKAPTTAAVAQQQQQVEMVKNETSASRSLCSYTKSLCTSWEEIMGHKGFLGVPQFACVVEV